MLSTRSSKMVDFLYIPLNFFLYDIQTWHYNILILDCCPLYLVEFELKYYFIRVCSTTYNKYTNPRR